MEMSRKRSNCGGGIAFNLVVELAGHLGHYVVGSRDDTRAASVMIRRRRGRVF